MPNYALTMYAPYGDLLLLNIKEFETRTRGVTVSLPVTLYIHTAKLEMSPELKQLAIKYLGEEYEPKYGHVIGSVTLESTIKMSEAFINQQTPQEIELGNWQEGRVAWRCSNRSFLEVPVQTTGFQAAPWRMSEELMQKICQLNIN